MVPASVFSIVVADQVLVLDGRALAVRHDSGGFVSSSYWGKPAVKRSDGQATQSSAFLVARSGEGRTVLDVLQEILAAAPHAVLVASAATARSEDNIEFSNESEDCQPALRTPPALTQRHLEVLAAMSTGVTEREVGRRLGISERTVQLHVANICKALGVRSRFQLGLAAARLGVI